MNFQNVEPIYTVKQGDSCWRVPHELYTCNRAAIKISNECPERYQQIISECIVHGWIEPVANFNSKERVLLGLIQ